MDAPVQHPQTLDCKACMGRGFVMGIDSGTREKRDCSSCNSSGIFIFRGIGNGGEPIYTAPKLSWQS